MIFLDFNRIRLEGKPFTFRILILNYHFSTDSPNEFGSRKSSMKQPFKLISLAYLCQKYVINLIFLFKKTENTL